jgi:hypothetical protein
MDPAVLPWRIGRYPYRSIYAQLEAEPSSADIAVGSVQTPQLAVQIVAEHNASLIDHYSATYSGTY